MKLNPAEHYCFLNDGVPKYGVDPKTKKPISLDIRKVESLYSDSGCLSFVFYVVNAIGQVIKYNGAIFDDAASAFRASEETKNE